ncbi:tetratricopeptide repeat protein [Roseibium porphyridii]|uniref:Tetratricopeptide repeat protein n=1 Tax=Roseibium porphyridii TaxID=2866279 RepID=A0ABY8F7D7_9HYPH|nr:MULTISPECIES: tetratricopeptide repeat protein [Stappiaceae]QFT30022.1 Tetratricopeptide repeat protein [Labrenzia sp. THAF82]WFE90694.1 tetratricopeptide repeat protein [Roseibium sp. KMA01]
MFAIAFVVSSGIAGAQPVPDLGPDMDPPSAEDFNPMPEDLPQDGGQVVVEEADPEEEQSRLDELYAELADTEDANAAGRITREIQRIWMDSGSDTVDVLMSRAGKAIQADDHGLALDLLDVVVVLKPSFAEGWNRRATVHYMREDFGKSLVDIERTLALEPRHWGALSGLAIIQRRLGFEDSALETFKRALEVNPGLENATKAVEDLEKDAEGEPA